MKTWELLQQCPEGERAKTAMLNLGYDDLRELHELIVDDSTLGKFFGACVAVGHKATTWWPAFAQSLWNVYKYDADSVPPQMIKDLLSDDCSVKNVKGSVKEDVAAIRNISYALLSIPNDKWMQIDDVLSEEWNKRGIPELWKANAWQPSDDDQFEIDQWYKHDHVNDGPYDLNDTVLTYHERAASPRKRSRLALF